MSKLDLFKGKTVLITGHSGFKGSWLSAWLLKLGANVVGLSLNIPTKESHFTSLNLGEKIIDLWGDVREFDICIAAIREHRPDFVFHLAAQPLVRRSYSAPHETFGTNSGGTLNLLEALRLSDHPCSAVFITSDKCYDNVEQTWGYRENDKLGGKDPYSGSKGVAELIIRSYVASFFSNVSPVRVAVGRAGNVVGGGDWAEDRIIPDAVRAWSNNESLKIRNPNATRPWQHVLEPLSGYLILAADLSTDSTLSGEAFNFGPPADHNYSVSELLEQMQQHWPGTEWQDTSKPSDVYEAGLLKLCCDKALHRLSWRPLLAFSENIEMTASWYTTYYSGGTEMWEVTQKQIQDYENLGSERGAPWGK